MRLVGLLVVFGLTSCGGKALTRCPDGDSFVCCKTTDEASCTCQKHTIASQSCSPFVPCPDGGC